MKKMMVVTMNLIQELKNLKGKNAWEYIPGIPGIRWMGGHRAKSQEDDGGASLTTPMVVVEKKIHECLNFSKSLHPLKLLVDKGEPL
ncbi:type II secretion system protein GspD [Sesbania bispinosa]|nr:type II secretion system protein GspD [Sesbania bispinosa]